MGVGARKSGKRKSASKGCKRRGGCPTPRQSGSDFCQKHMPEDEKRRRKEKKMKPKTNSSSVGSLGAGDADGSAKTRIEKPPELNEPPGVTIYSAGIIEYHPKSLKKVNSIPFGFAALMDIDIDVLPSESESPTCPKGDRGRRVKALCTTGEEATAPTKQLHSLWRRLCCEQQNVQAGGDSC